MPCRAESLPHESVVCRMPRTGRWTACSSAQSGCGQTAPRVSLRVFCGTRLRACVHLLRAMQLLFVPRLMKACISSKGVGGGVLLRAHTASRIAARPDRLVLCRPCGSAAGVTLCTAVPEMDLAVSAASNFRMCQSFSVRLIFKKYWLLSST